MPESILNHEAGPQVEHVRSMFEMMWAPLLAALNVLMEETSDDKVVSQCLAGLVGSVGITAQFGLEAQRDAFVASLTQFTALHSLGGGVRELRHKNLEAIRSVVKVARTSGNHLGGSWFPVLRCISLLDSVHAIGSGQRASSVRPGEGHETQQIEEANSALVDRVDTADIDRIFSNSSGLSDMAIVDFVSHLCAISREEIEGNPAQPRVFCLQRIVEITLFNMSRIRIVWSKIWAILSVHFEGVALHANVELAMYAIDSMRQLALKFLEKDELTSFHFQSDFLKPFDNVLAHSKVPVIKELVVRCLTQVVLSSSHNIRSGWRNTFMALGMAARESQGLIVQLAFDLLVKIVDDFFPRIIEDRSFGRVGYVDCVNCLCAYVGNPLLEGMSVQALDMLSRCTELLLSSPHLCSADTENEHQQQQQQQTGHKQAYAWGESEAHVRLWFPVLTGLGRLVANDPRLEIRSRASHELFGLLKTHGGGFSEGLWLLVYQGVLYPIFDDVVHMDEVNDTEWLRTTLEPTMGELTSVFARHFDAARSLLPVHLSLLSKCVAHVNEKVAEIGIGNVKRLLSGCGNRMSGEMWGDVCGAMSKMFDRCGPLSDDELVSEGTVDYRLMRVATRHRVRPPSLSNPQSPDPQISVHELYSPQHASLRLFPPRLPPPKNKSPKK